MTPSYIVRVLVVGGRFRSKLRLVKMWGVHCRESGLGVFLFAFRVSFSVQSGASFKTSTRRFQAWPLGTSQLLLRSQGPRGPIAIACPVTPPNQSLLADACNIFLSAPVQEWISSGPASGKRNEGHFDLIRLFEARFHYAVGRSLQ